jgi:hypothetical protein
MGCGAAIVVAKTNRLLHALDVYITAGVQDPGIVVLCPTVLSGGGGGERGDLGGRGIEMNS